MTPKAEVQCDLSLLPPEKQERLIRGVVEGFLKFLEQPGAREFLEAKKAELRAQKGVDI